MLYDADVYKLLQIWGSVHPVHQIAKSLLSCYKLEQSSMLRVPNLLEGLMVKWVKCNNIERLSQVNLNTRFMLFHQNRDTNTITNTNTNTNMNLLEGLMDKMGKVQQHCSPEIKFDF